jgi:hypothetical protein
MKSFSFGEKAVWSAQRYSRELAESVWSVRFYEPLLDLLDNDTWRSYHTEAFGRACHFEKLSDFLTHPDGLGWPCVPEVLAMIKIVSRCSPPPPPRKNEPADPPITVWAKDALAALAPHLTELSAAGDQAKPLAQHGKIGNGRADESRVDIVHSKPTNQLNSNSQERILRRLARDAPDVLERVKAGEFKSARAAAIEAGIIKPVPTIRLVEDVGKVAAAIARHLSHEQLHALVSQLSQQLETAANDTPPNC